MEIPNSVLLGGFAVPLGLVGVVWKLLNGKIEAGDKALLEKIEAGDQALIGKIDDGHTLLLNRMKELFDGTDKCERLLHKKVDSLANNSIDREHCELKERLALNRFATIDKEINQRFKAIDSKLCVIKDVNSSEHLSLKEEGSHSRSVQENIQESLSKIHARIGVLAERRKEDRE